MFKWEVTYLIRSSFSNNIVIVLLLARILILWNYFILFKYLILKFKINKFNTKIEIINFKNFILISISLYSLIFILFNFI
jgi:hypothetical protein